ncbi:hypothetical protein BD310DRAFT_221718 [Dichomitus squalens]|uniref:Uncharacterized protein n=1 Tax=Dichomitus squalens TaxID=114155 RepID=A0A4Q9PER1_9APHY|nr:hypothetical protein BD310DRAFT_221718 [Dichomitus squalens]
MASTPEPLPSLPPSPTVEPQILRPEEDVGRAWHDDEPSTADLRTGLSSRRKGKRRATRDEDEDEEDDDEERDGAAEGYPPTKEEEAEARRVQENLRRWEIAERQRRKAARESLSHHPTPTRDSVANNAPSFFADLLRRDSRKAPLGGVGSHHALPKTDRDGDGDAEGVPLEDLDAPAAEQLVSSPPTPEPENPFDTPSASRTSLNIPGHSAIMTESDSLPDEIAQPGPREKSQAQTLDVPRRPTLGASSSFAEPDAENSASGQVQRTKSRRQPPPPKPLDLPAPKAPPPHADAPHAHVDRPPEPVASPEPQPQDDVETQRTAQAQVEEDLPPVRWWHEWLCGCGEGPERGGDHQAGRTNPFE